MQKSRLSQIEKGEGCVRLQPQMFPEGNLKLAPNREGKERPKKETNHSRLVGGSFCFVSFIYF